MPFKRNRRRRQRKSAGKQQATVSTAASPHSAPPPLVDSLSRLCKTVSKSYDCRSTPMFEEVLGKFIGGGETLDAVIESPKAIRVCARLDPRGPPPAQNNFTHFLGHVVLHKFPNQVYQEPYFVELHFDGDHSVRCQFPSLAHYSLFAYNKKWREQWEDLMGAPILPLPEKYELGIGKYIGSWADAADEDEED